jgi:hypothetical protein
MRSSFNRSSWIEVFAKSDLAFLSTHGAHEKMEKNVYAF